MLDTTLHSRYKIIQVLGIGKFGTTYLATDIDLISSPLYVVKKIVAGADIVAIDRQFETQESIGYRVGQHPQVPSLVAKFIADGHRYLVREYIEGEILSEELKSGSTWSQTQVFDFLIDLIGILCFVHSFKYIHQKIDPHHIIRRSDDGRFNLIGFSSVKDLGNTCQDSPDSHPQNLDRSIYIPFEQEENASQFNSDLYAVGVIAIQALTGKFSLERDPASYELKWRDDVKIDHKLIKIIDRLVRPDYRNRYQSGLEVLEDLQSFALTQLPASKAHRLRPHLIFGSAVCTLLLGFGVAKLLSAANNKPQLLSPIVAATSTRSIADNNIINWQSYVDPNAKVAIKYPETWQLDDIHNVVTGETVSFISPQQISGDKYRENVSIRVENLANARTTLTDYSQSAIAEIQKYYRSAKIIESSSTILANRAANLVVYTGKDENSLPIKSLEVWTIDRGKAYILTYKAEPDRYYQFLETALAMINSFQLN